MRPAPSGVKCARKCCLQTSRFTFADRGLPNAELLLLLNKCVSAATSFVCLCCTHIPTQCYHLYIQCVVALLRAWSHSFEPDETITEINVEGLRAFRVVALASHSCFLRAFVFAHTRQCAGQRRRRRSCRCHQRLAQPAHVESQLCTRAERRPREARRRLADALHARSVDA